MNKFTVRPNKSVKDMISLNTKRRIIMVSPDDPRLKELEPQKAFAPAHAWDDGPLEQYRPKFSFGDAAERLTKLRSPAYIHNKLISDMIQS